MAEEVAAAMAALQKQIAEMKEEMKNLRRRNQEDEDEMEEDKDVWVEEQPGAGWQEFLQATKLPATAPAAKLLSTLLKDAPLLIWLKTQKMRVKNISRFPIPQLLGDSDPIGNGLMSKRNWKIACIPWYTCWKPMTRSKSKSVQLSYVRHGRIAITTEGAC